MVIRIRKRLYPTRRYLVTPLQPKFQKLFCNLLDWDLTRLRNAPYARHGYIFHDARLRTYFGQKVWYKPTTAGQNVAEGQFSPAERANIALLQRFKGCE